MHDANNALAAITANLELAERHLPDGKAREALLRASDAARLHAALLRLYVPGTERPSLETEPADAGAVVADIARLLTRTQGPSLRLATVPASEQHPIRIECELLEAVVAGLVCGLQPLLDKEVPLRLAAKATSKKLPERDLLHAADGAGFLDVSISATGDQDTLARAWGRRGSAGGRMLASVVRLVRGHGGSARLSTDAGEIQIVLRLPLARNVRAQDATGTAAADLPLGDGQMILVTGEDGDALEQLHKRIEGLGYSAFSVACEADAAAVTDAPAAIVLLGNGAHEQTMFRDLSRRHPLAPTILITGGAGKASGEDEAGGCSGGAASSRPALAEALCKALGQASMPLEVAGLDQASRRTSPTKT